MTTDDFATDVLGTEVLITDVVDFIAEVVTYLNTSVGRVRTGGDRLAVLQLLWI